MPACARFAPLGTITEEHYDTMFDINVKGLLFTVQKALAADAGRRVDHPERLDRRDQRAGGVQRLQRHQGRGAVVRADVDGGPEGIAAFA